MTNLTLQQRNAAKRKNAAKQKDAAKQRSAGLTVIVPTLNEAETIEVFLERLLASLGEIEVPREVIVVDDASPDGTAHLVEKASRNWPFPLSVLRRVGKPSLSLSVVEGARAARYVTTCVIDADLSHDPRDLPRIARGVLSLEVDVSVGSRYMSGGSVSDWPLRRRIVSGLGTRIARFLTQVNDPLSGYFAAKTALFCGEVIRPRGYKILLELLGRYRALSVLEVPIEFRDRERGESKFRLRQGAEFLGQALALGFAKACAPPQVGGKSGAPRVPAITLETTQPEKLR